MITPWGFDENLLLAMNFDGGEGLDFLMYWASQTYVWAVLYGAILWMVWRLQNGPKGAVAFLVVAALMVFCTEMTCNFFKESLPKFRPTHYEPIAASVHTVYGYVGGLYGTVSAHAANTLAFTILAGGVLHKRWVWWMLGAWCALVCYSRIYLGVHYPMDIFFGLCTGAFWGSLSIFGYRILIRKIDRNVGVKNNI